MPISYNQYIINAFTNGAFTGNPAAIVLLKDGEIQEEWLQRVAKQNNLSETGFVFPENEGKYLLRWFTPTTEVDLCGHATLAAAYAVCQESAGLTEIIFTTASGDLECTVESDQVSIKLPNQMPDELPMKSGYRNAFGDELVEAAGYGPNLVLELATEKYLRSVKPSVLDPRPYGYQGLILTAKSKEFDFVSRYFAPGFGIDEDPVTGSAHTVIAPYWKEKLGKKKLKAYQASERGGWLTCEVTDTDVFLSGQVVLFSKGEIYL